MDLDSIFLKVGEFGKYQLFHNYLLCGLAALYAAPYCLSYVFTSLDLPYRCYIPECENKTETKFSSDWWLNNSIPYDNTKGLAKCERYYFTNSSDTCHQYAFDRDQILTCTEWIYKYPEERNILTEFDLHCNENKWKLTSVGTLNIFARILGMPLTAFVSDKFGRRYVIIFGTTLSCLFGTLRSWAPDYYTFLFLEFLDAFFAAGFYNCAVVLGVELMSPNKRMYASLIINIFYTVGDIAIGTVGYYFRYWRHFLLIIYLPGVIFISYFWIFPESVRWLVSKKQYEKAAKIIEKMARWNNVKLNFDVKESLEMSKNDEKEEPQISYMESIYEAVNSWTLMCRLAVCSFCWMTVSFVWYGVTQQATLIEGDIYINFIISSIMQYPAYFICLLLGGYGRKKPLSWSFFTGAVASFSSYFIPADSLVLRISFVMIAKLISSISFFYMILISAEMFPTQLRHSMVAAANMVGMIGQCFAPQIPFLVTYYGAYFPMLVFGVINILAALLCLLLPETSESKLPDTVGEAKHIQE